jgi:prefoldin subunit 5
MNRSEIDLAARIDNLQNAINHQQAEINILRARLRDLKEERYRVRTAKSKID